MTGKLIMLAPRLVRDVRVEIGADWLISEISKPEGKVRAEQVQGFTIEKRRCLFRRMISKSEAISWPILSSLLMENQSLGRIRYLNGSQSSSRELLYQL